MKSFKPTFLNKHNLLSGDKQNNSQTLKLIPLGGVGDVTKNMYVYEYGNDIIIVDCGVGFPDEAMPGVDLVIPDISYLRDKKSKIRGIIITHGHVLLMVMMITLVVYPIFGQSFRYQFIPKD
jgi:predicted metal-dependent RNase